MRKTLNSTEIRQFVEALERQGFTPELAQLVEKDADLAKKIVETVAMTFLEDIRKRLDALRLPPGNDYDIGDYGGSDF